MFRYEQYSKMITEKFSFVAESNDVSEDSPIVEIIGYIKIMNDYKAEVNTLLLQITEQGKDFYKGELTNILNDVIYVDRELAKFNTIVLERLLKKDYPLVLKKD